MKNLESTFEDIKNSVTLSSTEKDFHRAELKAFMQERPMVAKPVRSPYMGWIAPAMSYSFAAILILAVSGTGVAFASEDSLPGSPLYAVKTRVSEPVVAALTFDAHERADLKVSYANKRLKEFAQVSQDENVTPQTTQIVAALLEQHISEASEDIALLQEQGDTEEAVQANADLQSTLETHQSILDKVQESNPESAESIEVIADTIQESIDEAATAGDILEETLDDTQTPTTAADVDNQAHDTEASLEELKARLDASIVRLEADDQATVQARLAVILDLVAQAKEKEATGEQSEAFLLYNEADQQVLQITTLIEGEQELQIDLIDAETLELPTSTDFMNPS